MQKSKVHDENTERYRVWTMKYCTEIEPVISKKGMFFEILCENVGMYFKNMKDLHNIGMIYVQIGRIFKGVGE